MSVIRPSGMRVVVLVAMAACGSSGGTGGTPAHVSESPPPLARPAPVTAPIPPAGGDRPDPEPTPLDPALVPWRAALSDARTRQIERLAAYRKAEKFPRNHIALGRIPIFVDRTGAHCAVAYLMRESGHGDLVAQIAREDNFVRIEEVQDGPLLDWIRLSGLTREEAALIQPGYSWAALEGGERDEEIARLSSHFTQVEALLAQTTEDSLSLALERVAPLIAAGKTPDDVVR